MSDPEAGAGISPGRPTRGDDDVAVVLRSITELAQAVLPGRPEISVTMLVGDEPATPGHGGAVALACDEAQYAAGEGPCLAAARSGRPVEVPDLSRCDEWAALVARAREYGIAGALSVPLPSQLVVGSLNVYVREAAGFDPEVRALAGRFARCAAVVVDVLGTYQGARDMAGHLEEALRSRAVIDQAKGILMERFRLTADQAFQLLAQASMATNAKLRDVAAGLVETGELPRVQR